MAVIGSVIAVIVILFMAFLSIGAMWINYEEHEKRRQQRIKKND